MVEFHTYLTTSMPLEGILNQNMIYYKIYLMISCREHFQRLKIKTPQCLYRCERIMSSITKCQQARGNDKHCYNSRYSTIFLQTRYLATLFETLVL